jgi:hypothetical protein
LKKEFSAFEFFSRFISKGCFGIFKRNIHS